MEGLDEGIVKKIQHVWGIVAPPGTGKRCLTTMLNSILVRFA